MKMMRQKTCRIASGTATPGFLVSVLATATDSTPASVPFAYPLVELCEPNYKWTKGFTYKRLSRRRTL